MPTFVLPFFLSHRSLVLILNVSYGLIYSILKLHLPVVVAIAGNIVPAIATANATVAGLVVLYAFRILDGQDDKCSPVHLRQKSVYCKNILAADNKFIKPNPKCYVCSPKPFVNILLNVDNMTAKEFETEILKKALNMIAPDAMLEGKGIIIISSDEEETMVGFVCVFKNTICL